VVGVCLFLVSPVLPRLFTDDPAVAASAALYLTVMPWGFGAVGAIAVANAAFNGLERPLSALAVSLARTLAVGVPAAWLGGKLAGEAGVLLGILFTNLAVGAVAAVWVLGRRRPARPLHSAPRTRRHRAMPHDGHHGPDTTPPADGWKHSGVRVIPGTASTPTRRRRRA
jgi:Na+-driven multidrug efflux pump